ncbi:unnamed protein product, partial [Mesorhabditis belari]|uniref:Uncharacterized protein n=1 Tax=Mesorhabditis belari TaxID=2138241 RepID=A0AAF3F7C0_9BILA
MRSLLIVLSFIVFTFGGHFPAFQISTWKHVCDKICEIGGDTEKCCRDHRHELGGYCDAEGMAVCRRAVIASGVKRFNLCDNTCKNVTNDQTKLLLSCCAASRFKEGGVCVKESAFCLI